MIAAVTTGELNLRQGPGTSYTTIKTLPLGLTLLVLKEVPPVQANGYTWIYVVITPSLHGWVSNHRVKELGVTTRTINPIGLHIDGGNYGGIVERIERLAKAGTPVPLVTIINHNGLPKLIKQVSPSTVTIFRQVWAENDPTPAHYGYDASRWWNRMWSPSQVAVNNGGVDYVQMANEWWSGNESSVSQAERYGRFYADLMRIAQANRIKITFGDIAVGNIENRHAAAMREMFEVGQSLGMPLNYHAYSSQNFNTDIKQEANLYAMRWVDWVKPYPNLKVVFGEAGNFNADATKYPGSVTLTMMKDFKAMLEPYKDRVLGAAWWTIAPNPAWVQSDITAFLNDYEQWMKGR